MSPLRTCLSFVSVLRIVHSFVTPEYVCILFVHVVFYLNSSISCCLFITLLAYFSYITQDVLWPFVCVTIYIIAICISLRFIFAIRMSHLVGSGVREKGGTSYFMLNGIKRGGFIM